MLSNIIAWIVFGALAGWIASMIVGNNKQQGAVGNIVVGVVGAIIGGAIVRLIGGSSGFTGFNVYSLLVAILGALVLLWLVRLLGGSSASKTK